MWPIQLAQQPTGKKINACVHRADLFKYTSKDACLPNKDLGNIYE